MGSMEGAGNSDVNGWYERMDPIHPEKYSKRLRAHENPTEYVHRDILHHQWYLKDDGYFISRDKYSWYCWKGGRALYWYRDRRLQGISTPPEKGWLLDDYDGVYPPPQCKPDP